MNKRELRGQTLDFIGKVATNPDLLASILSTDAGRQMLTQVGFSALTLGATPERLQKFFVGPSTPGTPNREFQEIVESGYSRDFRESAATFAAEKAERSSTFYQNRDNIEAPISHAEVSEFAEQEGISPADARQQLETERTTAVEQNNASRLNIYQTNYDVALGQLPGRSSEVVNRQVLGNIRNPGQVRTPSAQDFRGVKNSGDLEAFLFSQALGGVGATQGIANIERGRPGQARTTPSQLFSARRF